MSDPLKFVNYFDHTIEANKITTGSDASGSDVKFFGDTSGSYLEWDADTNKLNLTYSFLAMGAQGTGTALTTTYPFAVEIHAKPATVLTAGDTGMSAAIRARYEVGIAQTNQISLYAVDARLRPKYAMADGVHAGINAGIEGDAADNTGTSTTQRSAGHFYLEFATGTTFSAGWLCGVSIDSSVHGAVDVSNTTFAGLRIKTSTSKEPWTYGGYITGCVNGLYITPDSCAVTGKNGIYVATTFTLATSGVHKGIQCDITYTPSTSGYATPIAIAGKVSLGANFTGGVGYVWAIQGQLDLGTSRTLNNASSIFAGIRGVITGTTPTFTEAEGVCCAYFDNLCETDMDSLSTGFSALIFANNSGGQMNDAIYLRCANNVTNLFRFEDCGTMVVAQAAKSGTNATIQVDWEGTTYYINMYQA